MQVHEREVVLTHERAGVLAIRRERAHESDDGDQARALEQVRHLGGATRLLGAVGVGELKVRAEAEAEELAVQHERLDALAEEPLLESARERSLACPGHPRQPDHVWAMSVGQRALLESDAASDAADLRAARPLEAVRTPVELVVLEDDA